MVDRFSVRCGPERIQSRPFRRNGLLAVRPDAGTAETKRTHETTASHPGIGNGVTECSERATIRRVHIPFGTQLVVWPVLQLSESVQRFRSAMTSVLFLVRDERAPRTASGSSDQRSEQFPITPGAHGTWNGSVDALITETSAISVLWEVEST